jgi:hypothetical protein
MIGAEELAHISSYQTLSEAKNWPTYNAYTKLENKLVHICISSC